MVQAIILTHGTLGRSLLDSAVSLLGPQEETDVISNAGRSLEQISESLKPRLHDRTTIIFVDFCGGSTYMACRALPIEEDGTAVISGVNLPMLLSFFTKRDKLPFSELIETVKTDGLRGIQLMHND